MSFPECFPVATSKLIREGWMHECVQVLGERGDDGGWRGDEARFRNTNLINGFHWLGNDNDPLGECIGINALQSCLLIFCIPLTIDSEASNHSTQRRGDDWWGRVVFSQLFWSLIIAQVLSVAVDEWGLVLVLLFWHDLPNHVSYLLLYHRKCFSKITLIL